MSIQKQPSVLNDFGFSFEEENEVDPEAAALAANTIETLTETVESQRLANRNMYRRIVGLLTNLKKSPEKTTIRWPDRVEKIDAFIKELDEYKI